MSSSAPDARWHGGLSSRRLDFERTVEDALTGGAEHPDTRVRHHQER